MDHLDDYGFCCQCSERYCNDVEHMSTKNHSKSMSQPERAFWRECFLLGPRSLDWGTKLHEEVQARAEFADAAVAALRERVMWGRE